MVRYTRRAFLGAAAATGLASMAGCSGGVMAPGGAEAETDNPLVRSSFFVFGDVTARIAGDVAAAETLVPVGQHGHGWEPGPQIRQQIESADCFVYGMDGFQPWADDVREDLRADEADVVTVAAAEDIDLIGLDHQGHDDGEHEDHEEGEHDEDGHDGAEADDHESHDADDHEEGDDHDHGTGMDPHFWLDPLRVQTAVTTIEGALASLDEDHAEAYAENAAGYRDRLDDLHEQFEATLADATAPVFVAGHSAFGYLQARYDVDVVTLTGVAPDDQPTPQDVERAQSVIDEHDLQYVCSDPLESRRAAEELVAETSAESVLPLTALPGRREAWADDGWGYVEVMEEVNLATLEQVVGDA